MNGQTCTAVLVVILVFIALSMTTANALPCSYDICVNQSGWWPAGGAFNASNTPIQLAINNATAGDIVYVYNGSYTENVDVSTASLTLKGEGRDVVTVSASVPNDHVFSVSVTGDDYVNISGFTIKNATDASKAGIYLSSATHCNISNNTVSNNAFGIRMASSSSNNLMENIVNSNSYDGFCLLSFSINNNITCNWVHSNTQKGFSLSQASTGNNISCNNIIANGAPQLNGSYQWQFYNGQSNNVEAKNNYWGAGMNNSTIDASIYDNEEGGGEVVFNPLSTGEVPCAPIPEFTTVVLISLGLLALAGYYRIRRKA